jgi:hypothetical protein
MSLYDYSKTSDYSELNARLIILEKMFKSFLKDNIATLEEIKLIIDGLGSSSSGDYLPKDPYEEDIATYLPTVPNTLCTFSTNPINDNPQNSLFNYYSDEDGSDPIISVFDNYGTDVIFNINKKSNLLKVGGCKDWISAVSVGGKDLNLYGRDFISLRTSVSATSVNITLDNLTFTGRNIPQVYVNDVNKDITIPRGLRISDVNSQLLFHLPNQTITNYASPNMITIPYGTEILGTFNDDWNTYLPVVPNTFSTYPGVMVYNSIGTQIIFKIDRKNNTAQLGNIKNFSCGIEVSSGATVMYCKSALTIQCTETEVMFSNNVITALDRHVILHYGLRMTLTRQKETYTNLDGDEVENEYTDTLVMTNYNTKHDNSNNKITIPYGLNMGLSSTEFSVYDNDETKNITFPKGLRMVTDGNNLRVYKSDTVIHTNLKDQIQINYGFRVLAGASFLVSHKPGDTIDSGNASPNQIKMPFVLSFKSDDTYLTILKPGDSTKGVKLTRQTL